MSVAGPDNISKDVRRNYFTARLSVSLEIESPLYYLLRILPLNFSSDNPHQFISLIFVLTLSFKFGAKYQSLKMPLQHGSHDGR